MFVLLADGLAGGSFGNSDLSVQEHGRVERHGESRAAQIGDCASSLEGMSILGGGRAAER